VQDLEQKTYQDAADFINMIDKMSYSDRVNLLTTLLKKYAILSSSDVLMNKKDLLAIISRSKQIFTELPMPVEMTESDIPVHQTELSSLCVIEATIGHLNKLGCLKKTAKFDYKKR
jgi:hypothetical protein